MGILKALFGQKQDEMGIFTETTSAFDEQVEKVTAEHMMTENWALILDLCDKISVDPKAPKQALLSIRKRLNHRDPHVVILALSVLDSCWGNCGSNFRKEVSSAAFKNELQSKATHSTRLIAEKTRLMIRKWVETECKTDASLSLIVTLYKELLADGYSFESQQPEKKKVPISNDPNVVHSQEEEDAIAKAIALSLKDAEKQPKTSQLYPSNGATSNGKATTSNNNSMYPNLLPVSAPSFAALNISKNTTYPTSILKKKVTFDPPSALSPTPSSIIIPLTTDTVGPSEQQLMEKINQYVGLKNQSVERTVRALYDFEAAEDNELSFVTGDLITVTDDTNPNWWKGRIGGQFGLFPSSFVTSDLSEVKPELSAAKLEPARPRAVIDESILLECIQLLEECDPAGIRPDPPRLAQVESASIAQGPLIDAHLASIDRQSNALAQVDMAIRDVLALYDQAVQQTQYQPSVMYQQPPQMPMQGMQQQQTPQMPHQYAGYPNAPTGVMPPQQPQQPPMSMPYQPQPQYSTAGYAPPPQHVQPPQQMAPQQQQQQQPYQHYAPPPQPQQHQMSYHQPEWNQQQQPMQQPQQY